jgi:P27 family predicted phage terminase small subunit
MGRRGPRPDPTALKILRGNPGKRAISPREPKPTVGRPEVPAHLDAVGRTEWERVIGTLEVNGLVTQLDRAALAGYCAAWSRWVDAELKLREFGAVVTSPSRGYPVLSPWWTIASTSLRQMRDFLAEFGMSPASRTRIEADEPPALPGRKAAHADRFFPA